MNHMKRAGPLKMLKELGTPLITFIGDISVEGLPGAERQVQHRNMLRIRFSMLIIRNAISS